MSWASKMGPKAGTSAKASGPNKLLLTNLRTANVQEESVCAKDPSDVRFGVAVQLMFGHPGLQHTDCVEQTHRWTRVVSILREFVAQSPIHTS